VKRIVDFTVSIMLLLLLSPVLLVTIAAVAVFLGNPVLFRQQRPGLKGKVFTLYKLRSMNGKRSPAGDLLPDSERLTGFGKFLRSTSLDELPELWNVLKGDMSLVGPRPLLPEYLPLYSREQARRHEVRPGITGWAQVNGRNAISWEEKFRLDVWYVDHYSFVLDLKILMMTLGKVLVREGIQAEGQATAEKFMGSGNGGQS
jgi:sugar transferase EpsL